MQVDIGKIWPVTSNSNKWLVLEPGAASKVRKTGLGSHPRFTFLINLSPPLFCLLKHVFSRKNLGQLESIRKTNKKSRSSSGYLENVILAV